MSIKIMLLGLKDSIFLINHLQYGLHGGGRLAVGELQAGDGEQDLRDSDHDVLGQQPHHVHAVLRDHLVAGHVLGDISRIIIASNVNFDKLTSGPVRNKL